MSDIVERLHKVVMGTHEGYPWDIAAQAADEIERLRTRQSCEGDQPYICHALATARSRLADWHKVADDRSAEIVRLNARLAEAEALLDEVAYYPLQFAAKEPTARSVYERIKVFRAADSAPAVDCDWCKGSGRFINGEIWSWTQDGPKRGRCSCVCHTAADQPTSASVCPFQGPGKSVYTPTLCPVCNNDFRKCAEIRDADQPGEAGK